MLARLNLGLIPLIGARHHRHRRSRRRHGIAAALADCDDPGDAQSKASSVKLRAGATVGDCLRASLVERRFRLVDREVRAIDLVRPLRNQRIEDLP